MKKKNLKKLIILNIPYVIVGLFATNVGEAFRIASGTNASEKVQSLVLDGCFGAAFSNPMPSFHPVDLLVGLAIGAVLRLAVYMKSKNAKKFRHNVEYGSARWGNHADIEPYMDPVFENNVILSQSERLTMNSRPKEPKYARNKNTLVVGGSGSGKTRFFIKPNILQMHSSFVITDPKGTVVNEVGNALLKNGYRMNIFNTINFKKSMHYNPFSYVHDEKDILKLVTTLIANTKGEGKGGDEFWEKAEKLLYSALIGYIHYEAPEEEQNFAMVMEMLRAGDVDEDDSNAMSALDALFSDLRRTEPDHIALKYYDAYHSGSAKTLKSIQITLAARLEKFNLESVAGLTITDELDLWKLGEEKTALFAIIPDNDTSFNFLVSLLYTQLFQQLFEVADKKYGGSLPVHVQFLMDEFANVSLPDDFDKILSVMRSRGVSVSIILQNLAQLKALFEKQWESIVGNCDEFVYLGGNEKETHKYVSELLGKETIDTNTYGKSSGRNGNYSTNYQNTGRELMTPDEVRMLDNRYALLFVRGERPVKDLKYDILKHPSVRLTTDGQADPYIHGEPWDAGSSIELVSDPQLIAEAVANSRLIELPESSYELLSEEEAWNEFNEK